MYWQRCSSKAVAEKGVGRVTEFFGKITVPREVLVVQNWLICRGGVEDFCTEKVGQLVDGGRAVQAQGSFNIV
jgi:hypothetical protein